MSSHRRRHGRNTAAHRLGEPDAGSITLFVAVLGLAVLLVAGLVYDGGNKLTGARKADSIAQQAARAGADQVNVASLRTQHPGTDATAAAAAAQAYLQQAGVTGTATAQGPNAVHVTVTISQPTAVLGLLGIDDTTVTGQATATLEHGIVTEEP